MSDGPDPTSHPRWGFRLHKTAMPQILSLRSAVRLYFEGLFAIVEVGLYLHTSVNDDRIGGHTATT